MSRVEGLQRGSRSHATSGSRSTRTTSGSSTRAPRTSTSSRASASKKTAEPARPIARKSSAPRKKKPNTFSSFDLGLDPFIDAVRMAFTGEVTGAMRSSRIPSKEAHVRVKRRLRWTVGLLGFTFLVLAVWVGRLQTTNRSDYLAASIEQRTRVNTVRASRGVIFDRNGNELALSVPSKTVFVDPREVTDPAGTARALAPILGLTPEDELALVASLGKPGSKFHYLARALTEEKATAILGLGLAGVYSYTEPSRQVEGGVAQAVIGRTDPDGVGMSGLELQFDKILMGVDGKAVREVDKRGRSIAGVGSTKVSPVPGDDIVLTVDKNIQFHTDAALLDRVGQLGAKGGTAIVMDTVTGEIYAMSNIRRDDAGAAVIATGNFAAVEAYEPGSVAKVFSVSAALNEGKVTPETVFNVPGIRVIDKFPIRDAWPHGPIDMSVRTIVSESSNIGTMMTAETISSEKLHEYFTGFGFGQKSGLDYPGESRGILRDAKKWRGTEQFTVSYGYGLATTALQLVAGVNTVANGGVYVPPQLVSSVIDKSGRRQATEPGSTRQVLKPETAAAMTGILTEAVCTGTAELAKVKGMEVAGKTGTGYKAQANGTYSTDAGYRKYFASFVGYFPARAPRITMLVSIDEPSASSRDRFGGTAAAPVFARLVPTIMHELGIEATGTGTGCKAGVATAGL
jgi:cell division protein FtsI (penicillin-binding protein 3)